MTEFYSSNENIRLIHLKRAINNDGLEDENCPQCFCSLKNLQEQIRNSETPEELEKLKLLIEHIKKSCKLKKIDKKGELLNEFFCEKCNKSYIGELKLIAQNYRSEVLSFYKYDNERISERDIYNFPIVAKDYNAFIAKLWDDSGEFPLTSRAVLNSDEDIITGRVINRLEIFFKFFTKKIFNNARTMVKIYTESHAGSLEAGRRSLPPSGADFAIWFGPMTEDQIRLLEGFENGTTKFEELPQLVGNGVIIQAKKEQRGSIDRKQIEDFVMYASIMEDRSNLFGIPGKLFMKYSGREPLIEVFSGDFTYRIYKSSIFEGQNTVSFSRVTKEFSNFSQGTSLLEFVQSYLSGKTGTPLLMLKDILGIPIRKIIVGISPEPEAPSGPLTNHGIGQKLSHLSSVISSKLVEFREREAQQRRQIRQQMLYQHRQGTRYTQRGH